MDQRHKLAEAKDLAKAFATFQTQVAVNYAKTVKPYEQAKIAYLDAITVDGNCNQEAASQCVYMEYGLEPKKQSLQQCLAAAKCQTNWDKLTPAQQNAARTKFAQWKQQQDQVTGQTMQKIGNAVGQKLDTYGKNHMKRVQEGHELFKKHVLKFAQNMKCDNACVTKCNSATPEQTIPCLETCGGCFENIINIKWAPKAAGPHKLNEIEAAYGPVELIEDNEWEDLAQTFKQANI